VSKAVSSGSDAQREAKRNAKDLETHFMAGW